MYSKEERTALIGLGMPTFMLRFSKALVMLIFFYYAANFTENELLIGIAFGITAIIQAGLTIPFGFWSDKFGRKKMIIIGLLFFIIGSLLAAYPFDNIFILIFARILQGTSAIYSCVLGFVSEVIPDNKRSRTMGIFSIFTGIVFMVGIVLGPTISPTFLPYSFLFVLSAILAIIALFYLVIFVHEPQTKIKSKTTTSNMKILKEAFFNKNLLKIYLATFLSNFVLVSILFLLVPIMLVKFMPEQYSGILLIPIFILGMAVMLYASKFADKGRRKEIAFTGLGLVGVGLVLFFISDLFIIIIGLALFFIGMAILDPLLPSLILNLAPDKAKGTASGGYNLTRYLGEGVGPIVAGLVLFTLTINFLLILLIILIICSIFLISILKISKK